jgi:hypothetical protein
MRMILAVIAAATVGGALVAAQPVAPAQTGAEKVYIGCLVPGPTSGTYALISATEKGSKDKAKLQFFVAPGPKVNLEAQLTHEVEVMGTVSNESATQPTLNATKVKWRADYCG